MIEAYAYAQRARFRALAPGPRTSSASRRSRPMVA
jgi:hypothetical protein